MSEDYWDDFANLENIKKDFIFGTPTEVIAIECKNGFKCCTVLFTDHDGDPWMEVRVFHVRSGKTYTSKHSTTFHVPELISTVPYLFYQSMQAAIIGTEKFIGQKVNNTLRELLSLGGIQTENVNYIVR